MKLSQSFMLDSLVSQSDLESNKLKPAYCPRYLKYKYVDGKKTEPTPAMLNGAYFEWHLLGTNRDGIEPFLPRINVRDQRPTKSASKQAMIDYITSKWPQTPTNGLTVPELFEIVKTMPKI